MNTSVPYMGSVKNLGAMLTKMQTASCPPSFTIDFLKDMGFTSSNDRAVIKILKYIGFLDQNSKPLEPYKKYMDHTISKEILAEQLRFSFDDLFNAHKDANIMAASDLKGWFRTKTGQSEPVAEKMATTFKALADNADFSDTHHSKSTIPIVVPTDIPASANHDNTNKQDNSLSLVYRFEIHLPDTQNIDTYRAIFKAIKEELLK